MRKPMAIVILTAATLLPTPAEAQRIESARLAVVEPSADISDTARRNAPRASRQHVFWMRTLSGTLGTAAGAYSGYMIGRYYTPRPRNWDVMSDQEAIGLISGMFAGAAFGAAILKFDSKCSTQARFLRGLAGAAVGVIPAAILGPFGFGIGAAALQGRC